MLLCMHHDAVASTVLYAYPAVNAAGVAAGRRSAPPPPPGRLHRRQGSKAVPLPPAFTRAVRPPQPAPRQQRALRPRRARKRRGTGTGAQAIFSLGCCRIPRRRPQIQNCFQCCVGLQLWALLLFAVISSTSSLKEIKGRYCNLFL